MLVGTLHVPLFPLNCFFPMADSEEVASSDAFGFEAGLGGCRARPWSPDVAWMHFFVQQLAEMIPYRTHGVTLTVQLRCERDISFSFFFLGFADQGHVSFAPKAFAGWSKSHPPEFIGATLTCLHLALFLRVFTTRQDI